MVTDGTWNKRDLMPPRQMPLSPVRSEESPPERKRQRKYSAKVRGSASEPSALETSSPDFLASPVLPAPSPPIEDGVAAVPATQAAAAPVQATFLPEAATPGEDSAPMATEAEPAKESGANDYHHNSEVEFGRLLDYYGIEWQYEPRQFPLQWRDGRAVEMFTPDFYLPEFDLYIELTTMRQALVRRKNRKLRLLRALYPEINIKLLYRRDYQRLLERFGIRPDAPTIGTDGSVNQAAPAYVEPEREEGA
jgi:hypothetical protein